MYFFKGILIAFINYDYIIKKGSLMMTEHVDNVDTCCKDTCCADGCCSDGCNTGKCSSGCCSDTVNCCTE